MTGTADSVPPLTDQSRHRTDTRPLADAPGIGCETVRRPAPALAGHRRDRLAEPAI
jgi:hypothetical protein